MKAYIKGVSVVSPQKTFYENGFPGEVIEYTGVDHIQCVEPVYRDFIDPMVSRRMSRIVKMGVCAALKCLKDSSVQMPDGIITGTGLGCLEDTDKFLTSIYQNEEKLLNPTPFIQSTHNTVAGAIALAIKCHHYNATYTQRGFSFENAIIDALSLIRENEKLHILTGGFDELTANSYALTRRLGLWKNHSIDSGKLFDYQNRGSLAGEGVAFFMLSGSRSAQDIAKISGVETFYNQADLSDTREHISGFLKGKPPVDLVIFGKNGDQVTDQIYEKVGLDFFTDVPKICFKNLCGEYDTVSSFALWLAAVIAKSGQIPAYFGNMRVSASGIQRVLIYNHLRGKNHALYLIENAEL